MDIAYFFITGIILTVYALDKSGKLAPKHLRILEKSHTSNTRVLFNILLAWLVSGNMMLFVDRFFSPDDIIHANNYFQLFIIKVVFISDILFVPFIIFSKLIKK